MSELSRAVQDEVAAFRPDAVPPFAVVRRRRRARTRRAYGAAAVVVALAAGGTALATTGGQRLERLPADAAPATPTVGVVEDLQRRYDVTFAPAASYEPADGEAVARCSRLPGTDQAGVGLSSPPAFSLRVTGRDEVLAVERCLARVPGGVVRPRGLVLPDAVSGGQVCDLPAGALVDAAAFCRTMSADAAAEVAGALSRATATGRMPLCQRTSTLEVQLSVGGRLDRSPYVLVPDCGLLRHDGVAFRSEAAQVVRRAYDAGGPLPPTPVVPRCVDGRYTTEGYRGLSEAAATDRARQAGLAVRVLQRDDVCLGGSRDLRPDRLNLVVQGGVVTWAGVF